MSGPGKLVLTKKLDFQWKFDEANHDTDPLEKVKIPKILEKQPKSQRVKEEIVDIEGDNFTDRGNTVKTLGMQGSRFKQQSKIKHGTMTKWYLEIKEKGVIINIELRY